MQFCYRFALAVALLAFSFSAAVGQVDDVSDVTGVPIPIGAPVIYGQIEILGMPKDERRPTIFVMLLDRGSQIDRRAANSRGYYYFLQRPVSGQTLVFEVDGREIGRSVISAGGSNRIRQDVALNWIAFAGASRGPTAGTISAKDRYDRSDEGEKAFQKAMDAVRAQKNADAITQFNAIVTADPKDYFAWTMLGTIYMTEKKFSDSGKAFDKALEQRPEFGLALINYGKSHIAQKNFDKAIELLTKAVAADEASAEANHMLGEAYLQARKGSLAVGYLNKAIELAPVEKADIHLRLAALYNGAGLKDRAALEYKAFLEKKKDHPDAKEFKKYIEANLPKQ
ncbi:MAG: tetratricopeptide repeat protein [Pyrinomonadaceae bacterium]|nr:tetratricopeptide repeat protein [Pyrinomonadaceae bacterium]